MAFLSVLSASSVIADSGYSDMVVFGDSLSDIEQALPLNITRFDVFTFISSITAAPGAFRIDNVVDACLTPEINQGAVCTSPDDYFFWDAIHPTRTGHKLLAEAALSALQ